ncbi:MAG: efflux RND transporter permease subunit, partial [Alphaproteobacteria bacterium]|nr:efflux RND transporter permease subunit [Alphaproteobacteria bacterium]
MKSFNLSDWALGHRSFIWYLMIVSLIAGTMSYLAIGREEDPSFAIKTMVISAAMPGASIEDMREQVTDRIEKKLEELDTLDYTRSITRPGVSLVYVNLKNSVKGKAVGATWPLVRNMMGDIRSEMPQEFAGFQFNDNFGDVFGNMYAFTSDGFSPRELRDAVETVKRAVQTLPDAGKVEIFGTRDEVVFLEFSTARLAALGVNQQAVQATLQAQNAILPSGVIDAGPERMLVRVGGQFQGTQSLEDVNLHIGDRFFRLTDVADIRRGYQDPPTELFQHNGQPAIGLSVGMREGANIVTFGAALEQVMDRVQGDLPIGIQVHQVSNQPEVVQESVSHFIRALVEAVVIVLAVSFISLGLRAGLVVTLTIPLVLAITFVIMHYAGFTLQRISLGALIIALGLLVDDAMIAIETMITRLEIGENLTKSASYAWTSIAFPMLSGTLVTVAGFIPIGLNSSSAGEYTFSLFVVIAVSLLISWIVAVLFAPLIGVTLLPKTLPHHSTEPGRMRRGFRALLRGAMRFRWLTIGITLGLFSLSLYGMRFVEQQFFPETDRHEILVDFSLPQNASIAATQAEMTRFETYLKDDEDVLFWSSYIGSGAPRFVLTYEEIDAAPNNGQIVIQTPDVAARNRLRAHLNAVAEADFPGTDVYVKLLDIGPPVGRPLQYRISGPDVNTVRDYGRTLAGIVDSDARTTHVVMDWNEPARVVRVDIVQDKARQM